MQQQSTTRNGRSVRLPLGERYWSRVIRPDDADACWGWIGARHEFGYGIMGGETWRSNAYAHRVSWVLHFGPIPRGRMVLHRCDNPPCSNPRHLFLGTAKDNWHDAVAKRRTFPQQHPELMPRGERNGFAKLTEAQVVDVLERFVAGGVTKAELAREYGVTPRVIFLIVTGQAWTHIPRPASTRRTTS